MTPRRRTLLPALALGAALVAAPATSLAAAPTSAPATISPRAATASHYTIGLFGDMPYGDDGREEYPNLIADMNKHTLAFSVFDGDIKNGSEVCDDALYSNTLALFNQQKNPVVYTPGDNEWTDCDRESDGSYDPNERLALIRSTFFTTDRSLGQRTIAQNRQAGYPENARWSKGPVTYVTLNIPGSNNNLVHDPADGDVEEAKAEYTARNAANLRWLRTAFATATLRHSKAVMIVIQADINFDHSWAPEDRDGFTDFENTLRQQTIAFDGQVVLVHGDSHYFLEDKPLNDNAGEMIENFTRVETFGDANTHWVSATVDANEPQVFTFRQQIVPQNVEGHRHH